MTSFNITPLKAKLSKRQIVTALVTIVICVCFLIGKSFFETKELIIKKVTSVSNILSYNLSVSLNFQDTESAQKLLASISKEDDISGIVVTDSQNILFANYGDKSLLNRLDLIKKEKEEFNLDGWNFYYSNAITEDNKYLGNILIAVDLLKYRYLLNQTLVLLFILVLLITILSVLEVNYTVSKITSPIQLLDKKIREIIQEKDYSTRIGEDEITGNDILEVQNLYNSFNNLIEAIEHRDNEIQFINETLEYRIAEKTNMLEHERAMAIQSNKLSALGEMAGGVAHEINNPLAIINVSVKRIEKQLTGDLDKLDQEHLTQNIYIIKSTVERINKIITALRTLVRKDYDESKQDVLVSDIVEDVLAVCSEKFKSQGVQLKNNSNKVILESLITCQRIPLSQVLLNLLNNSFDEISDTEDPWIVLEVTKQDNKVYFSVTDSGEGIPEDVREKIFQPFYTTKEIGKGTGIGLSISKSIIEQQGGTIYYDPTSSNTRFIIEIPQE